MGKRVIGVAILLFCLWAMCTEMKAWGQVGSIDTDASSSAECINFGELTSLHGLGAYSVYMWFNPADAGTTSDYTRLLGQYGPTGESWGFAIDWGRTIDYRLEMYHKFSGDSGTACAITSNSNLTTQNAWSFVGFEWDSCGAGSTDVALYQNGTLLTGSGGLTWGSASTGGTFADVDGNTLTGMAYDTTTCTGLGAAGDFKLAHVHWYNRRLSAAEREKIRRCPGSVVKGLLYYFPLQDSSNQNDFASGHSVLYEDYSTVADGPPISKNCALQGGN